MVDHLMGDASVVLQDIVVVCSRSGHELLDNGLGRGVSGVNDLEGAY